MKNLTFLLFASTLVCSQMWAQQSASEAPNKLVDGVRQGKWRVEGKQGKIDEGSYVDGKKDGVWISYGMEGEVRSKITYIAGKARGEAVFYDDKGTVTEQGYWNVDHWEGEYTRYNSNGGKACQFVYDNKGRRQGRQIYYHENGKVMYDGVWDAGKIKGVLTAYDDAGHKILERNYGEDGKFVSAVEITVESSESSTPRIFTGTGNFTLFNAKGKVERKGEFVKGELKNGERYVYKSDGVTLNYIEVYSNGEMVRKK
ncbi:MAG: hypothetical protein MJZ01_04035 [Bacteroidales bacterium]|nr:hypothetical protein [Bacteroidales bacterium]